MVLSIKKMGPVLQCFLLSVLFLGFTNIFSTEAANSISVNSDTGSTVYKTDLSMPVEIQCNTSETDTSMQWEKNGKNITDTRIKITKNKLVIQEPNYNDLGNYSCRICKGNVTIGEESVIITAMPRVHLPKDFTVVEGEKLKLECKIQSMMPVNISWTFGNETDYFGQGRVKLDAFENVPNALFIMMDATMEDRGSYSCIATNAYNLTSSATSYVRVKDKLAALWPFLGICAEVFVLCAIILIYEKKRNKTELEESDTDNSPETKNTPDHGKDSVRQRK